MAKPNEKKAPEPQKVLAFYKEDVGGFAQAMGIMEIEIDMEILLKHGKLISKAEPDVFSVFLNNLTKKAREIFGI